ncbi:MAG: hypothetical protein HQ521_08590 [Bacteroidetes bacterium]|nr:hypothetical protein [Bacteroidota bacterium]
MNYQQFRSQFSANILVSKRDILTNFPSFDTKRLSYWQHKKYLQRIINNNYLFSDSDIDEQVLMMIANRIYDHSYISMEMALGYYGLIPEMVYQITSCSTRKTNTYQTAIASFRYQKINNKLFFGYVLKYFGKHSFLIASPEKAILDYLYLRSNLNTISDIAALRINTEIYPETINNETMENYLKLINCNALNHRVDLLREVINNA